MNVQCPHCSTDYTLPDRLLGPRGARIRCPSCARSFVVLRDGGGQTRVALDEPMPAESASKAEAAPPSDPAAVAAAVLDELAARHGGRPDAAGAGGRLFSEFGPEIAKAFDEYRRRLGPKAPAEVFRAALRDRFGVDLDPR